MLEVLARVVLDELDDVLEAGVVVEVDDVLDVEDVDDVLEVLDVEEAELVVVLPSWAWAGDPIPSVRSTSPTATSIRIDRTPRLPRSAGPGPYRGLVRARAHLR